MRRERHGGRDPPAGDPWEQPSGGYSGWKAPKTC